MRKPPTLRNNNGALQVRVRLNGRDHFINRLGRWGDSLAMARAEAIAAEIWRDACAGELDASLNRYCPVVEGRVGELVAAMERLVEQKPQARVTHAHQVLKRFGGVIRTKADADGFVEWMEAEGLAASTRSTVLSTLRSAQPCNRSLRSVAVKVPVRSVQQEVLSKQEIQLVLAELRRSEGWFYPVFALWLGTGLRNGELIGLRWDAVRLEERELVVSRSLRRDGASGQRRQWGSTKTGRSRVVPLTAGLVTLLQQHREQMAQLGLDTQTGLVFVTPRTHGHLYDRGLDWVWKRVQKKVGLVPRRLYAQRHSFLSHALAAGNSPADLAAVAGHRTEELLKTYAKPTGRLQLPVWC